jgi:amidase
MAQVTSELAFMSATEQAELVRAGQISPVELVEIYIERIERLQPELNAFVTVGAEDALAVARAAEGQAAERPFHGVPIAIKDLHETAGLRTTFSSSAFADFVPSHDVAAVRRLRDAGFIIIGKTNTPEFGTVPVTESSLNGDCRNPWDPARTPGGSSGGAAASLAAGLCPVAHGSDGGGSIRIPASCCGVFGLKPSRGRISDAPYGGPAGLSTQGPIARSVLDAAALLDVMAGYEIGDPHWAAPPERPFVAEVDADPGRLRIAVTTTPPYEAPVDPACSAEAADAAGLLQELGHDVEEAAPEWVDDRVLELFQRVWQVGPALYASDPELFDPLNRALAEAAHATTSVELAEASIGLQEFARRVVSFWQGYDLLLTPTLAQLPLQVGAISRADALEQFRLAALFTPFTPIVNVTGQPAISLPLSWTDDALPIGVQLIGRPADEATLLRIAAQLEQARPWRDRRPPLS